MNPVRELELGERPREWGTTDAVGINALEVEQGVGATLPDGGSAPARVGADALGELDGPQHYKVQFTATEEYVRLVDEAKALLSHAAPRATLDEVQLRAMRAFVEMLRKRKYGAPAVVDGESPQEATSESAHIREAPRQRGRHIPRAVRRAVVARDGERCTYCDASGRRCTETKRLEVHHIVPFARRPSHEVANLTLRCAAHNALAAEEDFGREIVEERRRDGRHERFGERGP